MKRVTIENFRCFASADVELNYPGRKARHGERLPEHYPNITLFIGPNGSGKTTFFQAICLSVLAPIIGSSGLRLDYFVRRPPGLTSGFPSGEPRQALPNCNIVTEVILDETDVRPEHPPAAPVRGQAVIAARGDIEQLSTAHTNPTIWRGMYESETAAFFLAAYGANRHAGTPEGYVDRGRYTRYQRIASIFEEYAGLVPFTVGFLELARRDRLQEAQPILNALLPEDVKLTGQVDGEGRPLFDAGGVLHPFSALSDGYRGFVAWVWDLLVNMARSISSETHETLLSISGVVIVDEIDLFLHPGWQRMLVEALAVQFPALQFLFSTHSPIVVGMLEAENLRVVARTGHGMAIEQYSEPLEGKTPNEVLRSSYFGLSSTRAKRSGTIRDQVERVSEPRAAATASPQQRGPLSEEQSRSLRRLMARGREFAKAQRRAEPDGPEPE